MRTIDGRYGCTNRGGGGVWSLVDGYPRGMWQGGSCMPWGPWGMDGRMGVGCESSRRGERGGGRRMRSRDCWAAPLLSGLAVLFSCLGKNGSLCP
ncbi:hypothetical protein BO71DRAFT_81074 [Aspergillus ellipticus CBS 707.79]|uniref:Uncharacterized protein n=1 Tax=Aspergillus ellipticus CBS 707.79 TaxID=1448320 RepID=A0A319CYG2_9EURO|nr:hypothetical protein BO71DRAFT_81074 [Aspergillus ellipticus CBS 707.79]